MSSFNTEVVSERAGQAYRASTFRLVPSTPLPIDPIAEARRQWIAHGWADSADGMAVVTSVMRAHQLLLARVDAALRGHGLSFARYEVLMLLSFSRTGRLPLGKVGARLQVQPGAVTNAVDRLERQGFVRRKPHASDRRTTLAVITPRGRKVAMAATDALNANVFSALELGAVDSRRLFRLLERIRSAAGDFVVTGDNRLDTTALEGHSTSDS
jgi:DNA-binding MarR family transcriptional regulator